MKIIQELSDEYIKAIKWLKPRLNDYRELDNIDRIVFFNIWVISYYIFRYNQQIYKHTPNSVSELIKNIENILEKDKNYIYNRLYYNLVNYNFNKEEYTLCLKLLKKTKYDINHLDIVNNHIYNEKYNNDLHNLHNIFFKKRKYIYIIN